MLVVRPSAGLQLRELAGLQSRGLARSGRRPTPLLRACSVVSLRACGLMGLRARNLEASCLPTGCVVASPRPASRGGRADRRTHCGTFAADGWLPGRQPDALLPALNCKPASLHSRRLDAWTRGLASPQGGSVFRLNRPIQRHRPRRFRACGVRGTRPQGPLPCRVPDAIRGSDTTSLRACSAVSLQRLEPPVLQACGLAGLQSRGPASAMSQACGLEGLRACGLETSRACGLVSLRSCGLVSLRSCGLETSWACSVVVLRACSAAAFWTRAAAVAKAEVCQQSS